jgi:serine protease AprX
MVKALSLFLVMILAANTMFAGLSVVRSNGITLTGADGVTFVGLSGITLTGADGFLNYRSNGITLTGADGIALTGADGITLTGADSVTYTGSNGITLTGADGITLTGADGITLTGADGITFTGADGSQYSADSVIVSRPNGITFTGADGITLTGADGITFTGADGITLTGADGITLTGADGITLTGADSVTGFGTSGVLFDHTNPAGITFTGADGITLTGADGITFTGADGITFTGADGITLTGADDAGLQSIDPELAIALNNATDDSSFNAVIVYHGPVTETDLNSLRSIGILGGTQFEALPMIYISATRSQIVAVSQFQRVRSIYGNRTLSLNADPFFGRTGIERVAADGDLTTDNGGLPVKGRNVTVAVLDTGINSGHPDLAGKVVQNVKLADLQSAPAGFIAPAPIEGLANTDPVSGHGTFVGGIVAGSGASSGGKFAGVAPGARLLGLSAGDLNLTHVLAGFDYLLANGHQYNTRVVNCSFSANTVFDPNDPVNIATKMLTDSGVSVVVSAGNSGPGSNTLNPYAMAPWVIGVGAADSSGSLAAFSSRGSFGGALAHPSLVAPGVNVASLRSVASMTGGAGLGGADSQRLTATELPYYTTASGTSFSAPQVAGAIALMLEADPSLTPAKIKDILSRTATLMPKNFYHEAGAGMLNTHAAVLEAAFPERRMGMFRSTLSRNSVRFVTTVDRQFEQQAYPGIASSTQIAIPDNTVQAVISVSWGMGANDLGLKVFDSGGTMVGQSNYLNLPGITGRSERVVLRNPVAQAFSAAVSHTAGVGTAQDYLGMVELTRAEMPGLLDMASISEAYLPDAELSLMSSVMLPEGKRYRPTSAVARFELAETLLRAGLIPQYVAGSRIFSDVSNHWLRNAAESAHAAPNGPMFHDAVTGGQFKPFNNASRLVAAVAFVRAAGLEDQAVSATLPLTVTDAQSIPVGLRGHVAVALQRRFLTLRSGKFEAAAPLTRIELARAMSLIALH